MKFYTRACLSIKNFPPILGILQQPNDIVFIPIILVIGNLFFWYYERQRLVIYVDTVNFLPIDIQKLQHILFHFILPGHLFSSGEMAGGRS